MAKTEKWILVAGIFALWALLAYFAGGPVYSDEFLYIDVGLRNLTEPHYGNRYFHIYLQKLFMEAAPTPLIGIRVFWGFLMALTSGLIYYNARTFTEKSTTLHGLLAVAFFFSFSIVREYSGEPAVDITAMAVVSLYITIYLDLLKRESQEKRHLFFLGALTFIGFKTKETTIFVHLLLFGLLKGKLEGRRWFKALLQYFTPYIIGIISGVFIFIFLDAVFLGKPFFAISPSTFQSVFENYDFDPGFLFGPTSWYTEYLFDDILLPFTLFLLSGLLLRDQIIKEKMLIWMYPFVYIAFLSWNMLKVPWGFIERFIFPVLPVFAILATQTVDFKTILKIKKRWMAVLGILSAMFFFFVLRQVWIQTAQVYSFDYLRLIEAVYFPILISLLLVIFVWNKPSRWVLTLIVLFCIGSLLFTPLSNNYKYFVRYPKIRDRFVEQFYPLEAFKDVFSLDYGEKIYISTDLKNGSDMLSIDPNDISGMINFYYDERIAAGDVYVGYNRKKVASDLINRDFDYALLTAYDAASLMNGSAWSQILEKYSHVHTDGVKSVYLLER